MSAPEDDLGIDRSRDEADALRCPHCDVGVVADVAYDEAPDGDLSQRPDARQRVTYSCGHVVLGAPLAAASPEALDVERRQSEETVDPSPADAEGVDTSAVEPQRSRSTG